MPDSTFFTQAAFSHDGPSADAINCLFCGIPCWRLAELAKPRHCVPIQDSSSGLPRVARLTLKTFLVPGSFSLPRNFSHQTQRALPAQCDMC